MILSNFNKLTEICWQQVKILNLQGENYFNRLEKELSEINKKGEEESKYFLALYDKKIKVSRNEHNLMIWNLLGVCPSFDINKPPSYTDPEYPDVDVDYHPLIRDHLKNIFTFNRYGKEYVSNIVSYQTYGIKSSLADSAKVLGYDKSEVVFITTRMGMKDDEDDDITFEGLEELFEKIKEKITNGKKLTKFEEIARELSAYKDKYPDVWDVAKNLVTSNIDWTKFNYGKPPHRKKSMGTHASGLIISGVKLTEFVPLVVPPGSRELNLQATAWVEGLADTDCSSVGLIKFDYLGLEANAKIAECNRLIMERHGLKSICAKPGLSNWSDISYLNDPKALAMANIGDLKGIFQFDSSGIRKLVKKGGVTSFDDMAAYNALYRPAILNAGLHEEYCDKKNGKEGYEIHPLLEPIIGKTFSVALYQEQIMRILNVVGDIPLKDCEAVRKAISKKKEDKIKKYREMFIVNGQKNLGESEEYLKKLYNQIEEWSGYGFNKCVHGDTLIYLETGEPVAIKDLLIDSSVNSIDSYGKLILNKVVNFFSNGVKDLYELKTDLGREIKATKEHGFLTLSGWKQLQQLKVGDRIAVPRRLNIGNSKYPLHKLLTIGFLVTEGNTCHPSSIYFYNKNEEILQQYENIVSKFKNTVTRREIKREVVTVVANTGVKNGKLGKSHLYKWLMSKNMVFVKATKKTLPNLVWNLNARHLKKLLGVMWSCDGHLGRKNRTSIFYATSSSRLADQLVSLHLKLGIVLSKSKKKFKYNNEIRIGYTLSVVGGLSKINFLKHIGPYCTGRQDEIEWLKKHSYPEHDCKDTLPYEILDLIKEECKGKGTFVDISRKAKVSDRNFIKNKIKKGLRRNIVLKIARAINSKLLEDLSTSDIFWDKISSIDYIGKDKVYDITVENSHNYVANNMITHNSHAVAYAVIAMRQLWQKAYFPLEFFTSALKSLGTGDHRIIDYIRDARNKKMGRDIQIQKVDLNKSKIDFEIIDEKIYYGFSKIKGIGESSAKRIVDMQPCGNLRSFIEKFGTDAKVLHPLIALGAFKGEKDPYNMYLYYEAYKKLNKCEEDRVKRNEHSVAKYMQQLSDLLGPDRKWEHGFDDNYFGKLRGMLDDKEWLALCAIKKKYDKCMDMFLERSAEGVKLGSIDEFDPKTLKLSKNAHQSYTLIKPALIDLSGVKAEEQFYGFSWNSEFENCENYKGFTFDDYDIDAQRLDKGKSLPVEVKIESVEHVASKSGKMHYWRLRVVDGLDPNPRSITVWEHDYARFQNLLRIGNIVRMRLFPPEPPYPNYSLEGVKPWENFGKNRYGDDPRFDMRVVLLTKKEEKKMIYDVDDSHLVSPGRKKKKVVNNE